MQFGPRPGEHTPRAAHLAAHERRDGTSLMIVGALVEQKQPLAIALMDRTGPVDVNREVEPVERHVLEGAALDVPRPSALALAARWPGVEVTRAPEVAIARDQHP